ATLVGNHSPWIYLYTLVSQGDATAVWYGTADGGVITLAINAGGVFLLTWLTLIGVALAINSLSKRAWVATAFRQEYATAVVVDHIAMVTTGVFLAGILYSTAAPPAIPVDALPPIVTEAIGFSDGSAVQMYHLSILASWMFLVELYAYDVGQWLWEKKTIVTDYIS
ncbi:MAG: hypothetical protein ABEI86_00635, partial [Halobacteriaceae archaeon]